MVRPVTAQLNEPVVVQVAPPGVAVTEYPVITAPPFETGSVQDTTEETSTPELPLTEVGAPGTVEGNAEAEAEDAVDVPLALVAVTVKV